MSALRQRIEALEDRTGPEAGCVTPERLEATYRHALELAKAIMAGPEPEPRPGPSATERIIEGWVKGGWA